MAPATGMAAAGAAVATVAMGLLPPSAAEVGREEASAATRGSGAGASPAAPSPPAPSLCAGTASRTGGGTDGTTLDCCTSATEEGWGGSGGNGGC